MKKQLIEIAQSALYVLVDSGVLPESEQKVLIGLIHELEVIKNR